MNKPTLTVSLEVKSRVGREFSGHGSIFGNTDLGGDIVLPGAFKRSLAQHRKAGALPLMFWGHDSARVPGKWTDMHEDEDGLAVTGTLAETPLGEEIQTLLDMKAVRGLSIGYVTKDQDFDDDGNRLIKEVDLWEVSIVSLPMNPLAQVAMVKTGLSAQGERVPTVKEFESILRNAGCSRKVASMIAYKVRSLDDEGTKEESSDEPLVQPEDEAAVKRAQEVADKIMADLIKRRFAGS